MVEKKSRKIVRMGSQKSQKGKKEGLGAERNKDGYQKKKKNRLYIVKRTLDGELVSCVRCISPKPVAYIREQGARAAWWRVPQRKKKQKKT
jgi:hypothetical protein